MSDSNQTRHYTPTPAVRQAVQDAQRMLMYAVQSRLSLDHDTVKTLTRAKNVLRQNAWTPGEEIEFWKDYVEAEQENTSDANPIDTQQIEELQNKIKEYEKREKIFEEKLAQTPERVSELERTINTINEVTKLQLDTSNLEASGYRLLKYLVQDVYNAEAGSLYVKMKKRNNETPLY